MKAIYQKFHNRRGNMTQNKSFCLFLLRREKKSLIIKNIWRKTVITFTMFFVSLNGTKYLWKLRA